MLEVSDALKGTACLATISAGLVETQYKRPCASSLASAGPAEATIGDLALRLWLQLRQPFIFSGCGLCSVFGTCGFRNRSSPLATAAIADDLFIGVCGFQDRPLSLAVSSLAAGLLLRVPWLSRQVFAFGIFSHAAELRLR